MKTTCPSHIDRERTAREFIPPAQIDKAKLLAKEGSWSLNTIAQMALAIGLDHIKHNRTHLTKFHPNPTPENVLRFPH